MDFSSEKRRNATYQSTTDPYVRLHKKGECTEAKLRYLTHAVAEERNGLMSMSRRRTRRGKPKSKPPRG